ncbi:MAG: T9SS type A sorting domain-containing protein [Lentimicrobiaceae bacterium]|nr:T9SS type A sorting domain-containing protein [Lentimicrobiaceae bacterium]
MKAKNLYLFIIVIVLTAFSKTCFCQADTNELIKVQIDSLSDQAISVTGYITDSLVKNLRLPGEYGGVSPLDVCYVGYGSINKLYVYGDHRILIYYCSAHGNINVIQCTRNEIPLDQASWKWLSFPRLQRTGNDPVNAQNLLSTITPFPEGINFLGWNNPGDYGTWLNYDQITNWTSYYLNTIQSTLGYKIYTTDSDHRKSILPTPGTVLDAGTSVTIYSNHDNWIGYFLPNSQMPADAFGTVMMNKLKMIKTQNWTMAKVNGVWIGTSGIVPFKYGDMVVVNYEDHLFPYTTFAWQLASEAEDTEMAKAENFTYTETSDYVPIYVEVDSADQVKEIAAYVDGVCVGAAVAGDTLVEVNAYISDTVPAGCDIELVKYYGTKSTLSYVKDYWVYNPVTFSKEKRKLKTGGKADYYMVSFKNKEVMTFTDKPSLTCYPNPFRTMLTFNYTLPYETNVTLNIYNLNGALVSTLVSGRQSKGSFGINWDGTNNGTQLPNGIYIARLTTGKDILQSKITLIK